MTAQKKANMLNPGLTDQLVIEEVETHLHVAVAIMKAALAAIVKNHHDVTDDGHVRESEKASIVMYPQVLRAETTIVIVIGIGTEIEIESEKETMMRRGTKIAATGTTTGAIVTETVMVTIGRMVVNTTAKTIVKTDTMSDIIEIQGGTRKSITKTSIDIANETRIGRGMSIDTMMKARDIQTGTDQMKSQNVSDFLHQVFS